MIGITTRPPLSMRIIRTSQPYWRVLTLTIKIAPAVIRLCVSLSIPAIGHQTSSHSQLQSRRFFWLLAEQKWHALLLDLFSSECTTIQSFLIYFSFFSRLIQSTTVIQFKIFFNPYSLFILRNIHYA